MIAGSAYKYHAGDTISLAQFGPWNTTASEVKISLKITVTIQLSTTVTLVDANVVLPPNVKFNLGPLSLLPVTADSPTRGFWVFEATMKDPTTGILISRNFSRFEIE